MILPLLLLSPGESQDRSGALTPDESTGVSIVAGQYGDAWNTSSEGLLAFNFSQLKLRNNVTILVRMVRADSGGFYLGNWSGSDRDGSILTWLNSNKVFGTISGLAHYDDWRADLASTREFITLGIQLEGSTIRMFDDGQFIQPYSQYNLDNKDTLTFSYLNYIHRLEMYDNTTIESIVIYDQAVSPSEIDRISNMPTSWTWENTTIFPEEEVKPRRASASAKLIPSLWKVTRDNEFIEDLTPYVRKGRVTFNPDRSIKWDFEAEISTEANIVPFKDYIAPHIRLEYEDGHVEEAQFGIYNTVPPKQSISQTQRTVTIDSRDLTWQLSNMIFENGYSRNAGFNIVETVRSLLEGAGFTRHSIPSFATTFPNAVSWKAGTSRLEVINNMLNMISYYTLFMDRTGYLVSLPYVTDKDKAVSVAYDTSDRFSVVKVLRTIQHDTTPDRIANRVVVIGGDTLEEPIVAVAINNSPNSPTSTVNLGMTITKTYEGAQVANQEAADLMAKRNLDIASQEYHRLTLNTTPDLSVEPYDVYRLNILDAFGETAASGVWNSRGFSVGFTPNDAVMTHDLSNIDDPPMEV